MDLRDAETTDSSWLSFATRNDGWKDRVNYGNLESNLAFLKATEMLRKDHRILEIGSGNGAMLQVLHSKGYNIRGCDIDPDKLALSKELFGVLPYEINESPPALPFNDGSFDTVLSFDVFEHIPDSDQHLLEVSRILKPHGSYLVQTPNKWTNVVFETIRWRSFTSWKAGHCSLHSLRELTRRFQAHGFDIQYYRIPVVNKFFKRKVKRFLGYPGLLALIVMNPDRLPMPLSTNFFVKATKC